MGKGKCQEKKEVEKEPLPKFSDSANSGVESTPCGAARGDKTFLMRGVERCEDLRAAMKDSSAQVWSKN